MSVPELGGHALYQKEIEISSIYKRETLNHQKLSHFAEFEVEFCILYVPL